MFAGALVCTSDPSVGVLFTSVCAFGAGSKKGLGLGAGVGASFLACSGAECIEDLEEYEHGFYVEIGPVTFFSDSPPSHVPSGHGGCGGVFGLVGGGLGAGTFLCGTVVEEM